MTSLRAIVFVGVWAAFGSGCAAKNKGGAKTAAREPLVTPDAKCDQQLEWELDATHARLASVPFVIDLPTGWRVSQPRLGTVAVAAPTVSQVQNTFELLTSPRCTRRPDAASFDELTVRRTLATSALANHSSDEIMNAFKAATWSVGATGFGSTTKYESTVKLGNVDVPIAFFITLVGRSQTQTIRLAGVCGRYDKACEGAYRELVASAGQVKLTSMQPKAQHAACGKDIHPPPDTNGAAAKATVVVAIDVDADGHVVLARVTRGVSAALDGAALNAVLDDPACQFEPARDKDGKAAPHAGKFSVYFVAP